MSEPVNHIVCECGRRILFTFDTGENQANRPACRSPNEPLDQSPTEGDVPNNPPRSVAILDEAIAVCDELIQREKSRLDSKTNPNWGILIRMESTLEAANEIKQRLISLQDSEIKTEAAGRKTQLIEGRSGRGD